MRRYGGPSTERDFKRGKRELEQHRPDLAVRSLRVAAEVCPATRSGELSRRLYWLAIALLRLDRPELAIKSLASAQKLRPRGLARSVYERRVNEYGMPKRVRAEIDDFYAFSSIKISDYIGRKKSRRFDSVAEKDAVVRLIGDSWLRLSRSGTLAGKSAAAKLSLFRVWPAQFPAFSVAVKACGVEIAADFRRKARMDGDDRCRCGSGLPFCRCCGRTASPSEFTCE